MRVNPAIHSKFPKTMPLVGGLGEADQMDGGDVGRKHRQADHSPPEGIARQKVVPAFTTTLSLAMDEAGHEAEADDSRQVKGDERPVEGSNRGVHGG
jgi:hypothetical protein